MGVPYNTTPELTVDAVGDIRIVTLNRPDALNAVNEPLHTALAGVWRDLAADDSIGAVILTGAGRAFSAGGDLDWFAEIAADRVLRERVMTEERQIYDGMVELKAPLVTAVNGPAVGLGCSLAVLGDLVLMSSRAYLADPHVAVGLVAGDGGVASWPLMTSLLKAKEFILLGERIRAVDAERLGLANHVTEPDELMPTAMEYARRLAALPRQAVRETKRAFNLWLRQAGALVLDFAIAAENDSFTTEEHRQAVAKLRDQRGQGST
ncbi:MAG TPA: enoyl-CoA hydratase-related protein [Ilumatobacteraceae bacterium]